MISTVPQIRVTAVDDHIVFREGLVEQINNEPDMTVVTTAGDGDAVVETVLTANPDVALLDINMPGLDVFSAVATIRERQSNVRIIFLSAFVHDAYIDRALQAKVWGYVSKSEPFSAICQAIRDVTRGWVHYSSTVRSRIVNTPDGPRLGPDAATKASRLSRRELELLVYLARGLSAKQIANTLHIATKTVDNHKSNLMRKLDIHDRVELARFAFREGIATP